MARIQVAHIRSFESADIALDGPIVFLTGPNDGGKTSLARTIAGLVAGTGEIFDGNSRQIAQCVIAQGHKGAAAKLYDDRGARVLRWSNSKGTLRPEEEGDISALPKGGLYSSALSSFLTMPPKERNAAFWRVFPIRPSRAQCDRWLADNKAAALTDDQWREVEQLGFDGAAESWSKSATAQAGQWAGVAGEAFGPEKANGWEAAVATCSDVDADIPSLTKAVDDAKAALKAAEKHAAALDRLPDNPAHKHTCPCCQASLMLRNGSLQRYETTPEDQLRAIREQHSSSAGLLSKAKADLAKAERVLIEAEAGQRDHEAEAKAKTKKARDCYKAWKGLNDLARMAGAKGVRMTMHDEVIDVLNAEIADVARSMELADPIEIVFEKVAGTRDDVVNLQIGGVPYDSLSGNRQWRARAILQIVIAKRTGADLVVMDEAEALDPDNRSALFDVLAKIGMTAVIATYSRAPMAALDLEGAGMGRTYWCEGGRVMPLSEARQEAEALAAAA